jgi:DNA-binding NarL/FixJ family response regulator
VSAAGIIKLVIVDDHPVVRNGLRQVQQLEPRIRIVGEAATMLAAIETAGRLAPDVILMDVRLPDGDGIEACRRIKAVLPETRILFLTSFADSRFVLAAMEAGAEGYLLKESDAQRIVDAMRTVLKGGTVFDPVAARGMVTELRRGGTPNPLESLTGQERRLLAEVALGKTDKEVAAALQLTSKTARNYLDRIFAKLNVHTRTEAAMLYARFAERNPQWD